MLPATAQQHDWLNVSQFGCSKADDWLFGERGGIYTGFAHTTAIYGVTDFSTDFYSTLFKQFVFSLITV